MPKPHHMAYHPDLNVLENNNILKKVAISENLYTPIYARNKISKKLYQIDSGKRSRNVSPCLRF